MKTFLKILLGIFAFFVLIIVLVLFVTTGLVKTSDDFFESIKEKDVKSSYDLLSDGFQSTLDFSQFKEYVINNELNKIDDVSWGARSFKNNTGVINGEIIINDQSIPAKLTFIKQDGWKIDSIYLANGSQTSNVPSVEKMVAMVDESMMVFAESVNAKSMVGVYEHISHLWKKQISTEQLDELFNALIEADIDLTVLSQVTPVFDFEPEVNEDGVLGIKGVYPTSPSQVYFEFKYIYEGLAWKMMGISININ